MRLRRTPLIAIATAVLGTGALTAALLTTGTTADAQPARTSHPAAAHPAAARPGGVPWTRVGPGWVLAQYTTAAPEGGKAGPVTLYLISPGGARYRLARWPDSRTAPGLVAWSPDGKRALFQVFSGKGSVSLLWYDPATQAEQWLIRPPAHVIGVTVAVPFYSRQNGNL